MAEIFGKSNRYLFSLPVAATTTNDAKKAKFNVQVNSDTKVAQVYQQGELILGVQTPDINIGTYNLETKKFTPFKNEIDLNNPTSVRAQAVKYFSSQDGIRTLQSKSAETVRGSAIEDKGQTAQEASETTKSVTGTTAGENNQDIQGSISSFNQKDIGQAIGKVKYREKYSGGKRSNDYYIYPLNKKPEQDYIKFAMFRYQPKKVEISSSESAIGTPFKGNNTEKLLGTVYLPIQPQISDSNRVSWNDNTMNSLQAMAGAAALGAIQGGGGELADALEQISTNLIGKSKEDLSSALAAYFAGKAVGANAEFFTRVTGAILNPNLELLFTGPLLRTFTFTFVMSAREADEAEEIRRIIRFFKQGMSTKRTESGLFLSSPNVFNISYVYGKTNKDHPWINRIKTCALQDCTVNYTPDGNYATYKDGAMTQYSMSLTFGEIDPIYDDDYEGNGADITTEIGY